MSVEGWEVGEGGDGREEARACRALGAKGKGARAEEPPKGFKRICILESYRFNLDERF